MDGDLVPSAGQTASQSTLNIMRVASVLFIKFSLPGQIMHTKTKPIGLPADAHVLGICADKLSFVRVFCRVTY
mgnify:CR=1 FL=1